MTRRAVVVLGPSTVIYAVASRDMAVFPRLVLPLGGVILTFYLVRWSNRPVMEVGENGVTVTMLAAASSRSGSSAAAQPAPSGRLVLSHGGFSWIPAHDARGAIPIYIPWERVRSLSLRRLSFLRTEADIELNHHDLGAVVFAIMGNRSAIESAVDAVRPMPDHR